MTQNRPIWIAIIINKNILIIRIIASVSPSDLVEVENQTFKDNKVTSIEQLVIIKKTAKDRRKAVNWSNQCGMSGKSGLEKMIKARRIYNKKYNDILQ